jgi:predicted RNA binding protein YcfA (HicA-like mRNA interferase family)
MKKNRLPVVYVIERNFKPAVITTNPVNRPKRGKTSRTDTRTGGIFLKVREIIKVIEADGWYLVMTKGSHRQYKHPEKSGRITIAGHLADDLAPGTMNSIYKQAQLKE